jgi:ribosome-binding factor A
MTTWRQEQLAEVIAEELSDLIRTRMKDPRIGFASITDVELSGDLRHAKVFVSVLGTPEEQRATLQGLEHAAGFLRHELAQRLTIRHTPEVLFRLDESIERGTRILQLIHEMEAQEQAAPSGDALREAAPAIDGQERPTKRRAPERSEQA